MKVLESVMEEMMRFGALYLNVEDAAFRLGETSLNEPGGNGQVRKFPLAMPSLTAPNKLKIKLIFVRTNVFGTIAKSRVMGLVPLAQAVATPVCCDSSFTFFFILIMIPLLIVQ
jgi:hypothetical protein